LIDPKAARNLLLMALHYLPSCAWKLSILAPNYSARILSLLVSCTISRGRPFQPSFRNFELPPCVRQETFPLHLAIRLERHRDLHFSVVATLLVVSDDL
jgi:hypothetical protein